MGGEDWPDAARLPHGYTNLTTLSAGVVRKRYLGPDAQQREHVERAALEALWGRFPVPRVLPSTGELGTAEVAGRHGQEVLDDSDEQRVRNVLRLCGRLRRDLSEIDPESVLGLPGAGNVIVHGDFGPQNLLVNNDGDSAQAVVDWEWAHLGNPIEDLAWAEWIVRTHHPDAVPYLGELFDGYGARPGWADRKSAMLRMCHQCKDLCERWDNPAAAALWSSRIAATSSFTEVT
jgi:aminoglycoside phosphotransferase (APT) family kinase protein